MFLLNCKTKQIGRVIQWLSSIATMQSLLSPKASATIMVAFVLVELPKGNIELWLTGECNTHVSVKEQKEVGFPEKII